MALCLFPRLSALLLSFRRPKVRFALLIIDEFGCGDRFEREESQQAAHLLYTIIALRNQKHATALVINVDFDKWGDYLPDSPVAMAFLDRLVEVAIILKIQGKSYRAHRPKEGENPEWRKPW